MTDSADVTELEKHKVQPTLQILRPVHMRHSRRCLDLLGSKHRPYEIDRGRLYEPWKLA